jgi:hypothetical protein
MAIQASGGRSGWAERLEALARAIPGVRAYQDREGLRETDKVVRTHLAELLVALGRPVEEAIRRLGEAKRLNRLPALDRILRLLNTLADRIRFGSYGFAGVFDLHKIREQELSSLHRFDLGLVDGVARLRGPVQTLADLAGEDAGFAEAVHSAETCLQEFERTLTERDQLARGL